jgi:hypothetical protein
LAASEALLPSLVQAFLTPHDSLTGSSSTARSFSIAGFVDRRFLFNRRRFVAVAVGFEGGGYGYPYYDSGEYGAECFVVRHRIVNPWGYVVVRRRLVCG